MPAAAALLVSLALLHFEHGYSLFQFQLNISDDQYYWHQIVTAAKAGNGGGYTVYEEQTASWWSHFGAWGPAYPLVMGLVQRIVQTDAAHLPAFGAAAFLLLSTTAMLIARPRALQLALITMAVIGSWTLLLSIPSGMQEPFHFGIALVLAALLHRTSRTKHRTQWSIVTIVVVLIATLFRPAWIFAGLPVLVLLMRGRRMWIAALIAAIGLLAMLITGIATLKMVAPYPYDANPTWRITSASTMHEQLQEIRATLAHNLHVLTGPKTIFRSFTSTLLAGCAIFIVIVIRAIRAMRERSGLTARLRTSELWDVLAVTSLAILPFALVMLTYSMDTGVRHIGPHLLAAVVFSALLVRSMRPAVFAAGVIALAMTISGLGAFREDLRDLVGLRYAPTAAVDLTELADHVRFEPTHEAWCNTILLVQVNPFTPALVQVPRGVGASVALKSTAPDPIRSRWLLLDHSQRARVAPEQLQRFDEVATIADGVTLYERASSACP